MSGASRYIGFLLLFAVLAAFYLGSLYLALFIGLVFLIVFAVNGILPDSEKFLKPEES